MPDSPGLFTILPTHYWDEYDSVSGSDFSTGSATLVDVTGITFAAQANALYEVEVMLLGQSSTNDGISFAVTFSAAGATGDMFYSANSVAGTTVVAVNTLGVGSGAIWAVASTDLLCFARATVKTSTNAGNIKVQAAKLTAGTLTIYIGSTMKVKRLF